ncbi:hypothetical protein [Streptomyces indicus]|uniref:Uncharacterized protein n=1 Tax=Streptomyces indicus TaxID=417292 RepID=A0A1G8UI42_9ACTN|nr:hypothetical protein [Streptomyces indicus]SDJ53513.1 hypothetical protein SAMN05421806_101872 [Streptomyces indicus]
MALFAVLTPLVMLGVIIALGRYEELLLPPAADTEEPPVIREVPTS